MTKVLLVGHIGNVQKTDEELVHVSPTRSREFALEFSKAGWDTTAAIYWPQYEQRLSDKLEYKHIDKIDAGDYDVVFCHLILSIQQLFDLSRGTKIARGRQIYGKDTQRFQAILDHPRIFLQLDAPRPLRKNSQHNSYLVNRIRCVGVATENAVSKWRKMNPSSNVEWVNAATIAHKYPQGSSPYPETDRPIAIYLGRMNDASAVPPLEKLHQVASRLPEVDFHVVTNKIRDGKTNTVYAINELQGGAQREIRFHNAQGLVKLPNIFLHRGARYVDSFDWMHFADCAVGFAVRPDQDVASCKSWEYFGTGVPVVLEEGTPETWILEQVPNGEVAQFADWTDFANKIQKVLDGSRQGKYKRRKMRRYIAKNHGYDSRVRQWQEIMERHQ